MFGSPGVEVAEVVFPVHCLLSTVLHTLNGSAVEVGLSGHEGFSPLPLAYGEMASPHSTVVQIPGPGYSMSARTFLAAVADDAELQERVRPFAAYSFISATQFAMCNGSHDVDGRFARWILMAAHRVGASKFHLTQEYAAQMLSVRRASVTVSALALSGAGLISYSRGTMSVLDRTGLEKCACECYGSVNASLQQLLGYGARQSDLVA